MKRRRRKFTIKKPVRQHGFDLGSLLRTVAISDASFIEHLGNADVFGCGYGPVKIADFNRPIPLLCLVGKNEAALRDAFASFARWGGEQDGDAVEIEIALWDDGTYDMVITPEHERSQYRTMPDTGIHFPMLLGASWIHHFDSTHHNLRQIASYIKQAFAPVLISAAVLPPGAPALKPKTSQTASILLIRGLPEIVKFNLKIVNESEIPAESFLNFLREKHYGHTHKQERQEPSISPSDILAARKQVIRVVFPVSEERIARTNLIRDVLQLDGFRNVTPIQITQASINIVLSRELCSGQKHYAAMGSDFKNIIWDHIYKRFEMADGKSPFGDISPQDVAHQLELDARQLLKESRVYDASASLHKVQSLLVKRGLIDG